MLFENDLVFEGRTTTVIRVPDLKSKYNMGFVNLAVRANCGRSVTLSRRHLVSCAELNFAEPL